MKKSLLASIAAAALIASPALAQRQEAPPSGSEGPARAPAAIQNAPAEKVAPAGQVAPDKAAKDKSKGPASTTGQAAPSPARNTGDGKAGGKADTDARASDKADSKPNAPSSDSKSAPSGTTGQGSSAAQPSGAAVALTAEQKTKIRTTVLTSSAPRVTNVNFSISVGTVVPRTVRVVAVPSALVEIHPAWRGFMYFVHGEKIVVVEPGTLKIVTIIDV